MPTKPGVYQHLDSEGKVLYVGKAKNLKHRVSSYFNRQAMDHGKTRMLVSKVADIKYIVVESEADALLLENKLIKEHQPRYNINLKDDKSYPSIVIRKEAFPRIFPTRQLVKDGSEYHGPYASVRTMHGVLDLVKKLYPIRTCSLPLSAKNIEAGKFKVCLEYHLGNCLGPCEGKQSEAAYDENVRQIRKILRGHYGDTLRDLRSLMQEQAGHYQFEAAQHTKEKIELLEAFQARSSIYPGIDNTDVFTIASDKDAGYVNYLKVEHGAIVLGHTVEVRKKMDESDAEILEYAIVALRERFMSTSNTVFVPFAPELQLHGVEWVVPKIGDKKKLLELSRQNAVHYMLDHHKQQEQLDPARHTRRLLETI
ncbi:MAG: GIY-YIG nuclease family protein, partial [Flavobacteriales bacterium]|nr:GIY-YIG nuclease family protein [Flavobacteriales bacterium]